MSRPAQSTREKMTGALAWTFVPRLVQTVVSIGTSMLIFRTLDEFDLGTLKVLQGVLTVVVILVSFGLGQALNRFIPEIRLQGPTVESRALLYRSLLLQSAIWLVLCVILVAARDLLAERFPTYASVMILGVLLSICEVAAGTVNQYAIASYRTREMAAGMVTASLLTAVATAWLLHLGLRVPGVLLALAIGYVANVVVLAILLRGARAGLMRAGRSTFPWGRLLRYAGPWVPNNLLNFVVWRASETILLGIYWPRVYAAYFERAYQLPQMALEFIPNSIYPLVLAGFSESSTITRERMPEFISYYYRLLFFVLAPITVLGLAVGDSLMISLYGLKMAPAGPYCQAFFVIFTLSFFGTPLSMAIYVVEKVWVNVLLNVGYAVATLGLDFYLIPRYGLLGATIPTGIVTALTPIVRWYIAKRYVPGIQIPWLFIGRCFLAAAPLLLLFWAKQWAESAVRLLLLCIAGGVVTILSYRLLRVLGPEEREFIAHSRLPAKNWILRIF